MGKERVFDNVRYYLKKPGKGRASFSILKDVIKTTGERLQSKVEDTRIDAINNLYKQKLRDGATCEIEMKAIVEDLYKQDERLRGGKTFSEENRKLLEAYWRQYYKDKPNRAPDAARNRLTRAVDACGILSIASAAREELQAVINTAAKGDNNRQRKLASTLNQIMRFAGRRDKLMLAKKKRPRIRYLTLDDFETALKCVSYTDKTIDRDMLLLFYRVCFGMGGRVGEVFNIDRSDISRDGKSLFVEEQLLRTGMAGPLKNEEPRHAFIISSYRSHVREWAKLTGKKQIRNKRLAEIFKRACIEAFPDESLKHCTVHDLRHSYAVYLVQSGVPLNLVANSLGDAYSVVEEHYAGFVLRPEGIETMASIVG